MAKQNLKKRRVNHGPGSRERRAIKAQQAKEQLKESPAIKTQQSKEQSKERRPTKGQQAKEQLEHLLSLMTPAEKAETLKQIAEDNDEEAFQKQLESAESATKKRASADGPLISSWASQMFHDLDRGDAVGARVERLGVPLEGRSYENGSIERRICTSTRNKRG